MKIIPLLLTTGIIAVFLWAYKFFGFHYSVEEYLLIIILGRSIYFDLIVEMDDWDSENENIDDETN